MITVEIRDRNGTLLGKLWKSTSFVHRHPDYQPKYLEQKGELKKLALRRKIDGLTIFANN